MNQAKPMQMPQPTRYLLHRPLRIKPFHNLLPLIFSSPTPTPTSISTMRILDNISQRSWTQLKSDVKKVEMRLLIIVSDDVGMIIRLLEDRYFASG